MNSNRIAGNWKQLKGHVKKQWGKLTDDQFDVYSGTQDLLAGIIQESIGLSMEAGRKKQLDKIPVDRSNIY